MLEINKIHNGNCLDLLKLIDDNTVDVMVTSPPYFNARSYVQYQDVEEYMSIMKDIFTEVYRVLKNHHTIVVNVGDVTSQVGKAKWEVRKLPLGAYFTIMLEEIGFQFIDDIIWDKGEPQSKRHLGNPPYPYYQYPVNCYEHILIFTKNELNKEKIPCPVCNETIVVSNSCSSIGVQSWECKNPNCGHKSPSNRGKRYSQRSIMMNYYQTEENLIDKSFVHEWRRDIVKINPVIKVNNKGQNKAGHSAPYPLEIPLMAIKYYSGVGDLVLDPFMGSGTTAIASILENRNWIGCELSEEYIINANKRIDEAKENTRLF